MLHPNPAESSSRIPYPQHWAFIWAHQNFSVSLFQLLSLCYCAFLSYSTITITPQCLLVLVISSAYLTCSFPPALGSFLGLPSVPCVVGGRTDCTPDADGLDEQWDRGSLLPSQRFIFACAAKNPFGYGVLYSLEANLLRKTELFVTEGLQSVSRGFFSAALMGQCRGVRPPPGEGRWTR